MDVLVTLSFYKIGSIIFGVGLKYKSYGYRNFYHLRSRIILSTANNNVKNEAYRPLLFTEEDAIKKY